MKKKCDATSLNFGGARGREDVYAPEKKERTTNRATRHEHGNLQHAQKPGRSHRIIEGWNAGACSDRISGAHTERITTMDAVQPVDAGAGQSRAYLSLVSAVIGAWQRDPRAVWSSFSMIIVSKQASKHL